MMTYFEERGPLRWMPRVAAGGVQIRDGRVLESGQLAARVRNAVVLEERHRGLSLDELTRLFGGRRHDRDF